MSQPTGLAEIDAALRNDLTIDITTIGAKSGKPRRIEIWFLHVNDRFFITGTPGPRHWLANMRANPRITFHLKESVQADLPAEAREVTDLDDREMVMDAAASAWYIDQAGREDMVDHAPLVEIHFDQQA